MATLNSPSYVVAVVQLHAKPFELEDNFNRASNFIKAAADRGADVIVFPEYHLTGWKPQVPGFLDTLDQWEEYLHRYQALAKEHSICIVPGTLVERHRDAELEEDKLLNVAYFIGREGEIIGKYVKKNLWGPERAHLTSSARAPHEVFDTPIGRVGLLVCWDIAFPEAFRELIAQGATTIIIPTFWLLSDVSPSARAYNPASESLFLDSALTSRAFENTCNIVFANAGGPPGENYAGQSQVVVPFIGPILRLGGSGEGMGVVQVDGNIIAVAEENYNIRADLAKDDWHYDYRHDKPA